MAMPPPKGPIVRLTPSTSWSFGTPHPINEPMIGGWSGGGVLRVGQGRVAIYGELGIFATGDRFHERSPELQNPQLYMNTLHWLSGLFD